MTSRVRYAIVLGSSYVSQVGDRVTTKGAPMSELSKIDVICGMGKFEDLRHALSKANVRGITAMQVLGCGTQKGTKEYQVTPNYEMELLPQMQVSVVVESTRVGELIELIKRTLYTGHIGDGKIFVYELSRVVRVRTGDEGASAL